MIIIIIIIMEYPQQAALIGNISLCGQEKRIDRKTRKNRSEEKVAQRPCSPQENGRQSPSFEPWNQDDRPPDTEENLGSRCCQRLGGQARPRAHSR